MNANNKDTDRTVTDLAQLGAQVSLLEDLADSMRTARDRAIVDAWESGAPVRAIAEAALVSAGRVQQIVDEHAEKEGRRQNRALSGQLARAATAAQEGVAKDAVALRAYLLGEPPDGREA
ncbi:hypothetical protein [Conexibacter arvalis]|uniref:Uncharacterized protein n=1 Tax=Conexibacter arvalis TaxID=912552 RepID=A0A840IGG7_9ACTN|nr:hypothetical protein [Conexibacter arvalis]MBB4663058.1 hypothetical protein [Conexibacter arvalis]